MTMRQFNSPGASGEIPSCGCMPTGVEFRRASKYSVRKARRGTTSPPTARANCFAAFSRRAQTPTTAPARANANAEVRGQLLAFLQMLEKGLLVRQRYAEAADAQFGNRLEEITELMNQEWEIDG